MRSYKTILTQKRYYNTTGDKKLCKTCHTLKEKRKLNLKKTTHNNALKRNQVLQLSTETSPKREHTKPSK